MHALQIHLLYASIVWIAAWLLTSIHRGSATTKYWIWVATTLNFMLPLSVLPQRVWPQQISWFVARVEISTFSLGRTAMVIWLAGALVMVVRLAFRIVRDGRQAIEAPAVVGFVRPRIALPAGIERMLTRRELDAVLVHEQTHARRRDNLMRLAYELCLCAFWFHPFVWATGSRLALYRELSCDEAVADGSGLISALAKLCSPENSAVLHAGASSFVRRRLTALADPRPQNRLVSAILTIAFLAILVSSIVSPIARSSAEYLCAVTHGLAR